MPMTNRAVMMAACTVMALLAVTAGAQGPPPEASYFRPVVPPQPSASPGKIEVLEFFSYACPHCANFYPLVAAWEAKLPKDVVFKRVPVGFERPAWVNLQRAFYALQADGEFAKFDAALFRAIHQEQQPLFDEPHLADWLGRNGGNADKFASAYASFGVNTQTVEADKMQMDYAIDSVPSMAVDGRYVASANPEPGEMPYLHELLENTDKLIVRARAEHAAAAAGAKHK